MRSRIRIVSTGAVVGVVALIAIGLVGLFDTSDLTAQEDPGAGPNRVVTFARDPDMIVERSERFVGRHIGPRCAFDVPQLTLQPGQAEVRRRVTEIDYGKCEMTYEQGSTNAASPVPSDGSLLQGEPENFALPSGTLGKGISFHPQSPPAGYQQAHYKIEWWDIANIEVNAAYSYLVWARNGVCVTGGYGWAYLWWQNATGWSYVSHSFDAFYSPGLGCTRVQAQIFDAHFHNGTFCAGQNTDTYYDGVIIAGDYSGNIFGWRNDTWTTEPWWCPPLHWSDAMAYDY